MNMKLMRLKGENFKGQKSFEASFDGEDCVIRGENGSGKTTLYDMFLWALFGKDSTGRTDFEIRPLDKDNQPIKGLVTFVEAEIDFDGVCRTFRKELHEKVVKDQFRGYETLCTIDEVPQKVSEYVKYIDELVNTETFKLLTDISYFNSKLHHTERRRTLVALAGTVARPQGFESLLAVLDGRSVKDYEKVLHDRKMRHTKERDEINPRIDEIRRAMNGYAEQDTSDLQAKRKAIAGTMSDLETQRKNLLADEKARQNRIEQINKLTVQRLNRQSQMRSDASQTQKLLDEKARIAQTLAEREEAVNALHRQAKSIEASIESTKRNLTENQSALSRSRAELDTVDKKAVSSICYACDQKLPKAKLAENEAKRQAERKKWIVAAERLMEGINGWSAEIEQLQQQHKVLSDKATEHYKTFRMLCDSANVRKAEIDATIQNRPEPDYTQDAEYNRLSDAIAKLQAQVGESVAVQLEAIENRKNEAQRERDAVNAALVQSDRAKLDKARIAELEAKEKELAQKIAECDRQLADLADYKAAQSRLIETAVNGLFSHVQFKLFDYRLNGTIDETCEAMLNGVPYLDMSTGQQILAGVDVINVLSDHYGLSVPLFVDHAESLTLPLEAKSQVIELYAEKGVNELVVEVEEKAAVAA